MEEPTRIESLEKRLAELEQRLFRVEQAIPAAESPVKPETVVSAREEPPQTPVGVAVKEPASLESEIATGNAGNSCVPGEPGKLADRPGRRLSTDEDLEQKIGRTWLARIGAVAVSVGVLLLLKFTYDRLGPAARLTLGYLLGACLMGVGLLAAVRKYRFVSAGLVSAGSIALYFSTFAGYALFGLLGRIPSLCLMALITAVTMLTATQLDQPFVATVGLAGGFLAPALLGQHGDTDYWWGVIAYLATLNSGFLWLAHYRKWPWLALLGFGATQVYLMTAPLMRSLPALPALAIAFGFFALFNVVALYRQFALKEPSATWNTGLLLVNGIALLGWTISVLEHRFDGFAGAGTLAVAAVQFLLGLLVLARDRRDRGPVMTCMGMTVAFATLAVPLQWNGVTVAFAWLVESAFLTWTGVRTSERWARWAGALVFGLALFDAGNHAFKLLSSPYANPVWLPIELWPLLAVTIVGLFLARIWRRVGVEGEWGSDILIIVGAVVAAAAASIQWHIGPGVMIEDPYRSWYQFGFFAIWAAALMGLLLRSGRRPAKTLCRAVAGIIAIFLAIRVLQGAARHYTYSSLIWLDGYLMQGISMIALTILTGRIVTGELKNSGLITGWGTAATIEFWALMTLEFQSLPFHMSGYMRDLGLSLLWTVLATIAVARGLKRRLRYQRVLGLTLFGVTLVKVFFFDLGALRGLYRIGSFLVFGLLLIFASYLYQRWGAVFFEPDANSGTPVSAS